MRGILLGVMAGIAAVSIAPVRAHAADPAYFRPAPASAVAGFGLAGSPDVRVHRGGDAGFGQDGRDRRDHRWSGGRQGRGGDVYLPYREYQGDTLFRQDSFNDWWHDRPDRAFPRWTTTNTRCERQYWTGSGWRC